MKIYTCALLPFKADESFFSRDCGLLCRSLQEIGIDSKVVMPSLDVEDGADPNDVIRGSLASLRSGSWWKQLGVDGVVFVTWGFKEHTQIIRAARSAGIRTCAIIETNGNPFPYGDILSTIQMFWRKGKFVEGTTKRILGTLLRSVYFGAKGTFGHYHRSVQIGVPHFSIFDTPSGMERCLRAKALFPWIQRNSKSILIGYPIPDSFFPNPLDQRVPSVVSIGRWDALRHKRPQLLTRVIDIVLLGHPTATFEIFGRLTALLEQWHSQLPDNQSKRVHLYGVQPSRVISKSIGSSMVLYCPSASDGIPLAVVEGLCGGCSVAGLSTPDVAGLYWAAQEGDGTFTSVDSVDAHADAIITELNLWESGGRDPMKIAAKWKNRFSAHIFAKEVVKLISN